MPLFSSASSGSRRVAVRRHFVSLSSRLLHLTILDFRLRLLLLAALTLPFIALGGLLHTLASGRPWTHSAYLVYGLLFRAAAPPVLAAAPPPVNIVVQTVLQPGVATVLARLFGSSGGGTAGAVAVAGARGKPPALMLGGSSTSCTFAEVKALLESTLAVAGAADAATADGSSLLSSSRRGSPSAAAVPATSRGRSNSPPGRRGSSTSGVRQKQLLLQPQQGFVVVGYLSAATGTLRLNPRDASPVFPGDQIGFLEGLSCKPGFSLEALIPEEYRALLLAGVVRQPQSHAIMSDLLSDRPGAPEPFRFRYFEVFQDACAMKVVAIDVDASAVLQARENVALSPWHDRVRVLHGRDARAAARHADVSLPFPDLAAGCEALLAPGGAVCVVLPPTEAESFCAAAASCGLVLPRTWRHPWRAMAQ
eukprot:XP_001698361.1 predicted protein [Chlamydomonas reinhardtii]